MSPVDTAFSEPLVIFDIHLATGKVFTLLGTSTRSAAMISGRALVRAPRLKTAAVVCGAPRIFAASWNGIYIAEVARLSPARLITETTSSSIVMVLLGYMSGQ
jgi:hypothetical protein